MSEILEVYTLDDQLIGTKDREQIYKEIEAEFETTGTVTKKVKTVRLILLNSKGRVYLQKRSKFKKHNAGLFDKTIGGHVSAGQSFDLTLTKECSEELGFPMSVATAGDFTNTVRNVDLRTIGIAKLLEIIQTYESIRTTEKGTKLVQPQISAFYVGYYDGPLQFFDGESSGVEVFSIEELEKEIDKQPNRYTDDVKYMLAKYKSQLLPIKK